MFMITGQVCPDPSTLDIEMVSNKVMQKMEQGGMAMFHITEEDYGKYAKAMVTYGRELVQGFQSKVDDYQQQHGLLTADTVKDLLNTIRTKS